MISRFRVSATLARKIEELGVSPADVLRQAGLPTGLFDREEKVLLSTEELFALYRGLAEASRDPAIGLKLGTEHRLERYDPLAIAAVSARSFRDALERLARYKQLTCPEALEVVERRDESRVPLPLSLDRFVVQVSKELNVQSEGVHSSPHPSRR